VVYNYWVFYVLVWVLDSLSFCGWKGEGLKMTGNQLRKKFIEHEREKERKRLLEELGRIEEELEKCQQGKCLEMGVSQDECLYNPGAGCLCPPNEDGLLFCEWLKQKISRIEETLANL